MEIKASIYQSTSTPQNYISNFLLPSPLYLWWVPSVNSRMHRITKPSISPTILESDFLTDTQYQSAKYYGKL